MSQEECKVCGCKCIYNSCNLPLLRVNPCRGTWQGPWAASRANIRALGLGVGSIFWVRNVSHTPLTLLAPQGSPMRGGTDSATVMWLNCSAQLNDLSPVTCDHAAGAGRQRLPWVSKCSKTDLVALCLREGDSLGHEKWGSARFVTEFTPTRLCVCH